VLKVGHRRLHALAACSPVRLSCPFIVSVHMVGAFTQTIYQTSEALIKAREKIDAD
jgi:hypothetical protein